MHRPSLLALFTATGLLLSLPASAGSDDPAEAAMDRLVSSVMSEHNLSLIFGFLRQSIAATAEGKSALALPAASRERLEAAASELQRNMISATTPLLDQIEKEVRSELLTP